MYQSCVGVDKGGVAIASRRGWALARSCRIRSCDISATPGSYGMRLDQWRARDRAHPAPPFPPACAGAVRSCLIRQVARRRAEARGCAHVCVGCAGMCPWVMCLAKRRRTGDASAMPILRFVRIASACEPARVCALGELALAQGPCASHPPMPGARMWDRHRGMCMAAGCEWRIAGTALPTRTGLGRDVHQRMGYPHVE